MDAERVAKEAGFSLHAGVSAEAGQRDKLERLCRYISRPSVSEKHLSLTPKGNVRYQLKTPYRDGATQVIIEPLDFFARLASRCLNRVSTSPSNFKRIYSLDSSIYRSFTSKSSSLIDDRHLVRWR